MTPQTSFETGLALMRQGQDLASLPYLRRSFEGTGGRLWEVSQAIFTATMNVSFATTERYGTKLPATRSSVERVQLAREALHSLGLAEHAVSTPQDVAVIRGNRAQALMAWGFVWEAFVNYREAQFADSTREQPRIVADRLMEQMEHPARADLSGR